MPIHVKDNPQKAVEVRRWSDRDEALQDGERTMLELVTSNLNRTLKNLRNKLFNSQFK